MPDYIPSSALGTISEIAGRSALGTPVQSNIIIQGGSYTTLEWLETRNHAHRDAHAFRNTSLILADSVCLKSHEW